ncbi:hypothetical protein ANO11243_065260 [Dothideomycetidae sp. 11243]|nr:hypothetical protein ANO11243_065260 [fungal sp. No.11243]
MSDYKSTILVTGGTIGIGYEATLAIAAERPDSRIVICSRTDPDSAAVSINNRLRQSNVVFMPVDLSSMDSVRAFSKSLVKAYPAPISALVLNAGIQLASGVKHSVDGVESTFAVNHVGQALLLFLLAPHLAADARVIVVASGVHFQPDEMRTGMPAAKYTSAEVFAHPQPDAKNAERPGARRYCESKLANVLWTYAVARRFGELGRGWTINAYDPGLVPGTGLARDYPAFLQLAWKYLMPYLLPLLRILAGNKHINTAPVAGKAMAHVALSKEVRGVTGKYFEGAKECKSGRASYNVEHQEDLWRWTVDFVARDANEKATFERFQ